EAKAEPPKPPAPSSPVEPKAEPAKPAASPSPTEAKAEPAKPAASPQERPGSLAEAVAKMTLDVLVYSERQADRMVFINGRKYVEGQTIDGRFLVEGITREGAILGHEG